MHTLFGRIGGRLLPAALVASVACQDRSSGPVGLRASNPVGAASAGNAVLAGKFVLTVRTPDARFGPGLTVVADTGDYEAAIGGTGSSAGRLILRGAASPIAVFAPAGIARRQGTWEHDAGSSARGAARVIRFSAGAGAPPSEQEYLSGGEVVARVSISWTRAAGGWRMLDRTITFYRDGKATQTIELAFGEPQLAAARDVGASPNRTIVSGAAGGAAFDATASCDGAYGGVASALSALESAGQAVADCARSPWGCIGALASYYFASRDYDAATVALDKCLAAI